MEGGGEGERVRIVIAGKLILEIHTSVCNIGSIEFTREKGGKRERGRRGRGEVRGRRGKVRGEEGERRGGEERGRGGKRGVKYVEFLINPTSITGL